MSDIGIGPQGQVVAVPLDHREGDEAHPAALFDRLGEAVTRKLFPTHGLPFLSKMR